MIANKEAVKAVFIEVLNSSVHVRKNNFKIEDIVDDILNEEENEANALLAVASLYLCDERATPIDILTAFDVENADPRWSSLTEGVECLNGRWTSHYSASQMLGEERITALEKAVSVLGDTKEHAIVLLLVAAAKHRLEGGFNKPSEEEIVPRVSVRVEIPEQQPEMETSPTPAEMPKTTDSNPAAVEQPKEENNMSQATANNTAPTATCEEQAPAQSFKPVIRVNVEQPGASWKTIVTNAVVTTVSVAVGVTLARYIAAKYELSF